MEKKTEKIKSKFYSLPKNSASTNYNFKINKIIINLKKKGADFQFITASENVAWLLNIRGADAKYSPIPNSYILISRNKEIKFFCDLSKVTNSLKKYLKKIKIINIHNTNKILSAISKKNL